MDQSRTAGLLPRPLSSFSAVMQSGGCSVVGWEAQSLEGVSRAESPDECDFNVVRFIL